MDRRNVDHHQHHREREREAELSSMALQQHQQQAQMEFERQMKFYGQTPHGMLAGGPSPQHFAFEHLSEAAAHLMRPSAAAAAAGPGASQAALMSSLHQAAYLMYPPMAGGAGPGGGGGGVGPYLPSSYYQQYMAAAAIYGRGNPLWPYMAATAGGIPGPPGGSPLGISGVNRMGLQHSPMHQHGMSPVASREEGSRSASGFSEMNERMSSPGSPLALRMRDSNREREREREVGMELARDDSGERSFILFYCQ